MSIISPDAAGRFRRFSVARDRARRTVVADAVGVQAQIGQKLGALTVLDEAVGQAEADDMTAVQSGRVGGF